MAEQQINRRNNRRIEFNGETMTLSQWADKTGIGYSALENRLKHWPIDRALTEPVRKQANNRQRY